MTGALSHVAANLVDGGGTGSWTLDGPATSVVVRHRAWWGLANVHGSFTDVTGEGEILDDGTIFGRLRIATASLTTGDPSRDERLRASDFLDGEAHPLIVYTLTNIKLEAERDVWIEGSLMVRGVTAPLSFPARVTEIAGEVVSLRGRADVDLGNHDLKWSRFRSPAGRTTVQIIARFVADRPV